MDCHLAWSAELWEAEDAESFSKIAMAHSIDVPLPPLSEVVDQLLERPKTAGSPPWGPSLSPEHLLIIIYGKQSIVSAMKPLLLIWSS
jgi:hypothetical protein